MKPSDFFLSRRHFLGFFVPGALWLAAGAWFFSIDPIQWYRCASVSEIALSALASYVIGYVMQTLIFSLIYRTWRTWVPGRTNAKRASDRITMALRMAALSAARLSPQWRQLEDIDVSSDNDLAHYCKWRAASGNPLREAEFGEFEDEINFAISLAVVLLIFGIASFAGFHFGKPPRWVISAFIFALGCYMLWRFLYLKRTEERAWYTSFLLMPTDSQTDASKADQHDDAGTSDE